MKKMLLLLIVLIITQCKAQQKELDSLLNELKKHPQEDTVRLQLLLEASYQYQTINANAGVQLASEAIKLSKQTSSEKKLGTAYLYLAENYQTLGNNSLALAYCNLSFNIKKQLKDSIGMAVMYHTIGINYFNRSDYFTALNYEQQAVHLFAIKKDSAREAAALNSLGVDYHYLGDYPQALRYCQQALYIYTKTGEKYKVANAFTNMGLLYDHLESYKKALEYYNKALAIYMDAANITGQADAYGNIGNVYDRLHDTLHARINYRKDLELSQQSNYAFGIASAMGNLGISYANTNQYDEAIPYLQTALKEFTSLHDKANSAEMMDYLSAAYLHAPNTVLKKYNISTTKKFQNAEQLQLQSIALVTESKNLEELESAYENLSEIDSARNEYAKALAAYKQSVYYKDSILNNDKKQQITRLEMQYGFNKTQDSIKAVTDKQQALASAQIQQQRIKKNAAMAGAGFLFLAGLGGFAFYKRNRDIRFKQQITDTEMKALRAQMNPHFIFNVLDSISNFMIKNDTQKADEYLSKFAKLMRLILENSEQKEVSLSDDLKALEFYMQLEAMRMDNKFTYEIKVGDDIDKDNTLIQPLLLQPFVENSIKHGLTQKNNGDGKIIIHIQKENNILICSVEDNGIGRKKVEAYKEQTTEKSKSFGLQITNARIEIINKLKNTNASIKILDLKQGTKVEVKLPLELSF